MALESKHGWVPVSAEAGERWSMQQMMTGLYLGPFSAATREPEQARDLRSAGITHILVACIATNEHHWKGERTYHDARLEDKATQSLAEALPPALEFIDKARREAGAVLVHCSAG